MQAELTLAEAAKIIEELLASGLYRDTRFIRSNLAVSRKAGSKALKRDLDGEHGTSLSASSDPGTDMEVTSFDEEEPPSERGEAVLRFDQKKKGLAGLAGLAGLSYYHCKGEGSAKPRENRQRKRTSQKQRCKAKFTIRFSLGYRPLPDGSLNVRDHGNDLVVITWNKKHTHEVTPLGDATMKKKVRAEFRERVARGLSWQDFVAERKQIISKCEQNGEPVPIHLCEIKYRHWQYDSRKARTCLADRVC
ncbi:hypothetical protein HF325_003325 [Metschnikowia pulcherrima]|uniref:Uncharacterized protein n=1 Tax=Metschnikowia pulcherrima TaxID=27326 RepID=A0A8H7GRH0_9ASCO|nr:hypothetical protein HF325_003325 [Metschnikowia pulcherrima]